MNFVEIRTATVKWWYFGEGQKFAHAPGHLLTPHRVVTIVLNVHLISLLVTKELFLVFL